MLSICDRGVTRKFNQMVKQSKKATKPPRLANALALHKYVLQLFGVTDLEALAAELKDPALEGFDPAAGESLFYQKLVERLFTGAGLDRDLLRVYDQNITRHTSAISDRRGEPVRWKYFQWLALLFTEIYLDRYFGNPGALLDGMNAFLSDRFWMEAEHFAVGEFSNDDLNKVAFWNATGSGKTLLMHVNILQYRHYLEKNGQDKAMNRIIVLTPNEGLSRQHLGELQASGFEAEIFQKNAGAMFAGRKIEIIEITKLAKKSGDKTVSVDSFEGSNLVLVDEGHRGSRGNENDDDPETDKMGWKAKRNALCANGFSFEYSATFGQMVSSESNAAKRKDLLNEYGKSVLFDYSYKYFYRDGYGKDYQILNLPTDEREEQVNMYLTACLLTFYQQMRLYGADRALTDTFLLEKPLALFVGNKVTATRTQYGRETSDVVEVLLFLHRFLHQPRAAIENIGRIMANQSGLHDEKGVSIFKNSFPELNDKAENVYRDLLERLFHAKVEGSRLHLRNLKGQAGEIGLRAGEGDYFGVINVGDDRKLLDLCAQSGLHVEDDDEFKNSLFHSINGRESTINLLIGSKKFVEGWSSWRVSTMGMLNIGRGEGSEIIQLFGRGVRLKGYGYSLKRSRELPPGIVRPEQKRKLSLLETLNIFGIRADYMRQFKEYLEEEGLPTDNSNVEVIRIQTLPVIKNIREKGLKIIQIKKGYDFKKTEIVTLRAEPRIRGIRLNWYPRLQALKSGRTLASTAQRPEFDDNKLEARHLAFLDWDAVYFALQRFKNERSWHNLNIPTEALPAILKQQDWYELKIPDAEMRMTNFGQVRFWQEIAVTLLQSYCEKLYNHEKQRFFSDKLETVVLDETHPNLDYPEYEIAIDRDQTHVIQNITTLKTRIENGDLRDLELDGKRFTALLNDLHLYYPLLHMGKDFNHEVVTVQPVPLNQGEADFVQDLKQFRDTHPDFFTDKQLYLLRNLSRKGTGFFEANNFYPDFILWLVDGQKQYVNFIDPKGLRQVNGFENPKIQFHKTIRQEIEPGLNDADIVLNSFIVTSTSFGELEFWKGQEALEDFNRHHVYFQKEQRGSYVKKLLETTIKG